MASVKRLSVEHARRTDPLDSTARLLKWADRLRKTHIRLEDRQMVSPAIEQSPQREKARRIVSELGWLEDYLKGHTPDFINSINAVDYLIARSTGNVRLQRAKFNSQHGTRQLIQRNLLKERELNLKGRNKVFCSQWLSDRKVIIGTKCNTIEVLDLLENRSYNIPCLRSSTQTYPAQNACGIHAIELNPSRSLLVTGGENANDIAVYKLPTLDPLCIGERSHTDYIFDVKWLDDEFLVTGSRDSTIGLWRVDQSLQDGCEAGSSSKPLSITALATKKCREADKIRALLFNKQTTEIVALSLNAKIHLFSADTLQQKFTRALPYSQENVCLAQSPDSKLYAVGSKNHIFLLNTNTIEINKKIPSLYPHSGIRSLSFSNELLTIGTGNGHVLFYDLRKDRYLANEGSQEKNHSDLCTSKGYVERDDAYFDAFYNIDYSPAVYTHCYDKSGTKLFTAGGPLPANLKGSYAALWS